MKAVFSCSRDCQTSNCLTLIFQGLPDLSAPHLKTCTRICAYSIFLSRFQIRSDDLTTLFDTLISTPIFHMIC